MTMRILSCIAWPRTRCQEKAFSVCQVQCDLLGISLFLIICPIKTLILDWDAWYFGEITKSTFIT